MKNILLPTDFSANSLNAIKYAIKIYEQESCSFYLLHAFQPVYFTTESLMVPEPGEPAYDEALQEAEEQLTDLILELNEQNPNSKHHFKPIITYNSVTEAIEASLEKRYYDMIVMGTRGENDPENRILGSNTLAVLDRIKSCPVLMVPEPLVHLDEPKNEIVLATNYRIGLSRLHINLIKEFASHLNGSIRVLHIQEKEQLSEAQEHNKEIIQEMLDDSSHSFHTLTNIPVAKGIQSFIESRRSQVLVLTNNKPGFFKKLFSVSLLKKLGKRPQIPILVLPLPE